VHPSSRTPSPPSCQLCLPLQWPNKALAPGSGREVQAPAVAFVVANWVNLRRLSWVGSQGLGLHGNQTSISEDVPGLKSWTVAEIIFQCRPVEKSSCGKLGESMAVLSQGERKAWEALHSMGGVLSYPSWHQHWIQRTVSCTSIHDTACQRNSCVFFTSCQRIAT
jgi:hypothetical protein